MYLYELEIVVQDYGGSYTLSFYMYNTFVIPCQFTGARHKLSVFLLFVIHVSVFDHPNNDVFYSKLVVRRVPQCSMFIIYFCIVFNYKYAVNVSREWA